MSALPGTAEEQRNQDACTGVSTAFTVVSVTIVALRVYTRAGIIGTFGKDDFMMLGALLFTLAYLVDIFVLRQNGMGFSGKRLNLDQMTGLIKTTLSLQIFYYLVVYFIKISILCCYLRIAVDKRLEKSCKYTIYLLTVFVVICIIVCVTQCLPLHKMWDLTGQVPGTCINTTAFFYSTSTFNILTDIWIIYLPINTLLKIQRPRREKLALIFVFSLGVFSCIASIVRLHSIRIYTESPDPFYDSVPVNIWSMIEINIGIWCASIPALKALFIRSQREKSRAATGYHYHSRDKSNSKGATAKIGAGASDSDRSQGTVIGHGDRDSVLLDMKPIASVAIGPRPANLETQAERDRERTGSEDRIYFPGADNRV
ncbi:hypothetical protein BU24DRAFT_468705 [Aaosphaeria arxii CBS 175.79]|uniref:Rhodopsin domain-containing protein n=1 Tax=Aaosphaeria arxii CBS 175.79 TaxID=1450172 RepID=A0A6A5X6E1_9PLEO|nr:uncharacterized protein BU24DRAFT_468705 [Aaosphaeria arxii CBS 175.79]KAF2008585.1 hypothetical protein BU24DRAFT_468705 [Aaosphaeria arxii CBS 175.79]